MDENKKFSEPVPMSEVEPYIRAAIEVGGSVCVRVKGSSMWPFFVDGRDSVYYEALPKRRLRSGDILLYRRKSGKYVMHRLFSVQNDTLTFLGDNQKVLENGIKKDQLIAYVNHCVRNGKDLYCNRSALNLFMILYMKMRIRLPKTTAFLLRAAVTLKHMVVKKRER